MFPHSIRTITSRYYLHLYKTIVGNIICNFQLQRIHTNALSVGIKVYTEISLWGDNFNSIRIFKLSHLKT